MLSSQPNYISNAWHPLCCRYPPLDANEEMTPDNKNGSEHRNAIYISDVPGDTEGLPSSAAPVLSLKRDTSEIRRPRGVK